MRPLRSKSSFTTGSFSIRCSCKISRAFVKLVPSGTVTRFSRVITCENGNADLEALKAQAVSARSYLYYRLESTTRGLAEAVLLGLDCELRIAGWVGDEPRRRVLALAAQLGISDRVCLTGPYRQEDAPEIYQWADSLVMTKHNDPCPNTVLEAMACGLAVLYSNTGGVPELVGDCGIALNCEQSWTAIHVPEITDIAAGMVEIAPLTEDLGAAARARAVDKFDIAFWCMRHKEVFAKLVEQ